MGIVTISAYMYWFVGGKDSMDGWNAGVMFSEAEGGIGRGVTSFPVFHDTFSTHENRFTLLRHGGV